MCPVAPTAPTNRCKEHSSGAQICRMSPTRVAPAAPSSPTSYLAKGKSQSVIRIEADDHTPVEAIEHTPVEAIEHTPVEAISPDEEEGDDAAGSVWEGFMATSRLQQLKRMSAEERRSQRQSHGLRERRKQRASGAKGAKSFFLGGAERAKQPVPAEASRSSSTERSGHGVRASMARVSQHASQQISSIFGTSFKAIVLAGGFKARLRAKQLATLRANKKIEEAITKLWRECQMSSYLSEGTWTLEDYMDYHLSVWLRRASNPDLSRAL